ncbi:Cell surface antigen-like protein Sca13 [Rickettsia canadensis str. McKiel]|uniref:Cell surface antigen-like protein Sca13 n=1 Tax=Rickettsia canadensis (strain McKiel) TaxID=293613 RepID=A8F027_RICCK|nr:Cell surface antigen-like protein Sca13 [Rickettsia canadensis str. McKiel]
MRLGTIEVTEINTKSIDVLVSRELAIGIVNADAFSGANKLMVVYVNGDMDFQNNACSAVFASYYSK